MSFSVCTVVSSCALWRFRNYSTIWCRSSVSVASSAFASASVISLTSLAFRDLYQSATGQTSCMACGAGSITMSVPFESEPTSSQPMRFSEGPSSQGGMFSNFLASLGTGKSASSDSARRGSFWSSPGILGRNSNVVPFSGGNQVGSGGNLGGCG